MQLRFFFLLCAFVFFQSLCKAQTCTTRGQTPGTAFPVCGSKVFEQTTVPLCSSHAVTVPGCSSRNDAYEDRNPYWYKFTCYQSGTLGFEIVPIGQNEDYDWQLYDITGHAPEEVFNNPSLVVTGNWAGTFGSTGTRVDGSAYIECGSLPKDKHNTYAAMPKLTEGHHYLLLISHFSNTQSGYSLTFNGGTASIIQPEVPQMKDLHTNCEETQITLRLNKRIVCSSLATDGSDFIINAPGVAIISATAPDCATGFDADSLLLTLSAPLQPGNYELTAKKGIDGNTLLDNCDFELAEGSSLPVTIFPKQPTPFDSIAPVQCAPQVIELVFRKRIRCNSIAANGTDFGITSTNPVIIDAAYGDCDAAGVTGSIFLHLSQPVFSEGSYTITTQTGTDGNVIIDECGQETPALESVSFSVKDTVSAEFTNHISYGCKLDTITVMHDGAHGTNSWVWTFDSVIHRSGQKAQVIYNSFGEKTISLIASNGFCSDTTTSVVNLDNTLKAAFLLPEVACPEEPVIITNKSVGHILSYQWNFGNGNQSITQSPSPQYYPQAAGDRRYPVSLFIENDLHCMDTSLQQLLVAYSCHIRVPSAFTPNGDGINDYLYPLNAYKTTNLIFTVYNRLGQIVFQTRDRTRKWDGTFRGEPQGVGTYIWTLQFTTEDTKQFVSLRGTSVLIR